ncbi:MAG: outer membrane beta-barrel protein [Bacteroidales bacterium]|nr:outer membrane beta-barrel protein [Bacteroidales bacterium]
MKKFVVLFFLISSVLMFGNSAKAQFEYFGGGIALATGGEYKYDGYLYYNKSFGIDLRASYDYNKKLKIVPDFKIYLPNKEEFVTGGESKTTVYVFNLNAHYILNPKTRNSYHLYLLAGAHIGAWSIKDNHLPSVGSPQQLDVNEFKFVPGANAGVGMQFNIGNKTLFFAEVKYVIAKTNQLVFTPGLLYAF